MISLAGFGGDFAISVSTPQNLCVFTRTPEHQPLRRRLQSMITSQSHFLQEAAVRFLHVLPYPTTSTGYAAFMFNFMSKSSRRAVSQIATTAGCLSFLSAEMA